MRFTKRERSIIQVIVEESLDNFIFDGIKRKTGMHQQILSRTLASLEQEGIIIKTSEGYKVSDDMKRNSFALLSSRSSPSSSSLPAIIPLIQTILPLDIDLRQIISGLQGKWFGSLRWFGSSKTESSITLKWLTEDGKIQIEALFLDSSLSISAKLHDGEDDDNNSNNSNKKRNNLNNVYIKMSHQLMEQVIKLYSKQSNTIL